MNDTDSWPLSEDNALSEDNGGQDTSESPGQSSVKLRLRPVISNPASRPNPSESAGEGPPRPVIRSAEGLRRVFQTRPGQLSSEPTSHPTPPEKPPARKPSPRPRDEPIPTAAQPKGAREPTILGGVRTANLEPQGIQIRPRATAQRTLHFLAGKILTITEVVVVSALLVVLFLIIADWMTSNEEAAAEQRRQLTPTAELSRRRAVLPGSSQPPPGEGEIPPQFRPYLMPSTPVPLPTPGPRQATRIVIKKIGVDAPVLEGDDWQTLKKGVGHTPGTANPGEAGNCVLSGHDDVYGEVFRYLSELKPGDEVLVYTSDGRGFKYVVKTSFLVLPDAVEVLDPTPDPVLTLITCYPYLIDSHRLIVVCTLEGDAP